MISAPGAHVFDVVCTGTVHALAYNQIGNPLTYGNGQQLYTNLTWEHGRQLASLTINGNTHIFQDMEQLSCPGCDIRLGIPI